LSRLRDGDPIRLDARSGTPAALVPEEEWSQRACEPMPAALRESGAHGVGRELFAGMRRAASSAEEGACTWL
jgi:phosphogluconate dehydratase